MGYGVSSLATCSIVLSDRMPSVHPAAILWDNWVKAESRYKIVTLLTVFLIDWGVLSETIGQRIFVSLFLKVDVYSYKGTMTTFSCKKSCVWFHKQSIKWWDNIMFIKKRIRASVRPAHFFRLRAWLCSLIAIIRVPAPTLNSLFIPVRSLRAFACPHLKMVTIDSFLLVCREGSGS